MKGCQLGSSSTISPVTEEFKIKLQRAVEEARQKTAEAILNYIGELDDDGIPMKHYAWHEALRKKYGVKKGENMKKVSIYCDHCGKEISGMHDYTDIEFGEIWYMIGDNFTTDLCCDCCKELSDMIRKFTNKPTR